MARAAARTRRGSFIGRSYHSSRVPGWAPRRPLVDPIFRGPIRLSDPEEITFGADCRGWGRPLSDARGGDGGVIARRSPCCCVSGKQLERRRDQPGGDTSMACCGRRAGRLRGMFGTGKNLMHACGVIPGALTSGSRCSGGRRAARGGPRGRPAPAGPDSGRACGPRLQTRYGGFLPGPGAGPAFGAAPPRAPSRGPPDRSPPAEPGTPRLPVPPRNAFEPIASPPNVTTASPTAASASFIARAAGLLTQIGRPAQRSVVRDTISESTVTTAAPATATPARPAGWPPR